MAQNHGSPFAINPDIFIYRDNPTLVVAGGGPSLDLKRHLLARSAEDGLLKRFLRILNSWLGSLAEAIPGAHSIKELKEVLDEFLKDTPGAEH